MCGAQVLWGVALHWAASPGMRASLSKPSILPAAARYPALYGTIAVAAGYFLHIDPLGGLHWNSHDALLGLKCAVPILVMDAVLMLPDYSPGTTTKVGWRGCSGWLGDWG